MADITITAADVDPGDNAMMASGIAGATITAGAAVYRNAADSGRISLADADLSQAASAAVGIALTGSSADQPISYQLTGDLDLGATLAVGTIYVVSDTAGAIMPASDLSSGDYPVVLGIADAANNLKVSITHGEAPVP